jgi:hypothetical protein
LIFTYHIVVLRYFEGSGREFIVIIFASYTDVHNGVQLEYQSLALPASGIFSFGKLTSMPPSKGMVAPVTYRPAGLARNMAVPATSSSAPMRVRGMFLTVFSPSCLSVKAITRKFVSTRQETTRRQHSLLVAKGPHAIELLVMPSTPRRPAKCRLKWCKAALDVEYAYVSWSGTKRPSTEPIYSACQLSVYGGEDTRAHVDDTGRVLVSTAFLATSFGSSTEQR